MLTGDREMSKFFVQLKFKSLEYISLIDLTRLRFAFGEFRKIIGKSILVVFFGMVHM